MSLEYLPQLLLQWDLDMLLKKIINSAEEANVPIVENEELASSLSHVPIGDSIPSELYEITAEIIAYIYSIDK